MAKTWRRRPERATESSCTIYAQGEALCLSGHPLNETLLQQRPHLTNEEWSYCPGCHGVRSHLLPPLYVVLEGRLAFAGGIEHAGRILSVLQAM